MSHEDSGNSRRRFEAGAIVAGKYRIERTLAEGGMGLVVAATHLHLEQSVALKFLRGDIGSEWDALTRFTREARAAAQLKSEHVAHVLDAGVTDDGTPYMAMEYLEGHSLARSLQVQGALDVTTAVEYVIQACEGLAEAHSRGIVHRDIKPYNLFVIERAPGWEAIKILDFGISKFAFSDAPNVVTGVIIGSPCYMSPEQLRSTASVDHRSDIWSLGATLYELLAGRAAFDASQTLPELVAAILDKSPDLLRDLRPEIPEDLEAVVMRCLSKDRADRFQSAGEVAMALLPFAPLRARVPAERAASMKPAFRAAEVGTSVPPEAELAPEARPTAPLDSPVAPERAEPAPRGEASNPALERGSEMATPLPVTRSGSLDSTVAETESSRRRIPRWLGVATLSAAAVGVFAMVLAATTEGARVSGRLHSGSDAVTVPAVTRPEANDDTVSTPLAPAPPEVAELVVRASPASARISVDGALVSGNPFHTTLPKDGRTHQIAARAEGYEAKSEDVLATQSRVVDLTLTRRPSGSVGPGASRSSASGARASAKRAAVAPAAAPTTVTTAPQAPIATAGLEVDSAGGKAPRHPIETKDPYEIP